MWVSLERFSVYSQVVRGQLPRGVRGVILGTRNSKTEVIVAEEGYSTISGR